MWERHCSCVTGMQACIFLRHWINSAVGLCVVHRRVQIRLVLGSPIPYWLTAQELSSSQAVTTASLGSLGSICCGKGTGQVMDLLASVLFSQRRNESLWVKPHGLTRSWEPVARVSASRAPTQSLPCLRMPSCPAPKDPIAGEQQTHHLPMTAPSGVLMASIAMGLEALYGTMCHSCPSGMSAPSTLALGLDSKSSYASTLKNCLSLPGISEWCRLHEALELVVACYIHKSADFFQKELAFVGLIFPRVTWNKLKAN